MLLEETERYNGRADGGHCASTAEEVALLCDELQELESWFKKYDIQTIQYQRDIRLHGKSTIDIATLDAYAEVKAARIKKIKELLGWI